MPSSLKSLSKGLRVYRYIVEYNRPILAITLVERLGIDKSTISRILQTLKDEGFIRYLDNSNEIIANNIFKEVNQATKFELLIDKTKVLLEELSAFANECSYLGVFDNYSMLYLNQVDCSNRELVSRDKIGSQVPLHTNALGKSILAFGNYDLNSVKLNRYTNNTITDILALKEELDEVRLRGFSIDNREYQDGMRCVCVPLFNSENILIGAVGVSGDIKRLTFEYSMELGERISTFVSKYKISY